MSRCTAKSAFENRFGKIAPSFIPGFQQEDSKMIERISLGGKVRVVTGAGPGWGGLRGISPNAVPGVV